MKTLIKLLILLGAFTFVGISSFSLATKGLCFLGLILFVVVLQPFGGDFYFEMSTSSRRRRH